MKNQHYPILLALGAVTPAGQSLAAAEAADTQGIEVIEVTARKRVETLQDVPDAITAFNESDIESARIENVGDFVNLTPNVLFRKTFRAGASYITMRGITGTQQGLPPVTYVIDGVQVGAADFINQDMGEIERIEVLRGPQGALYGAGAMAGAINIITKQPTQDLAGKFKLQYGEGNDISANGYLSGGVTDDIYSLVAVGARDSDGLIDSSDGDDLDFNQTRRIKTRWQYLGDALSADLRLGYAKYDQGAITQDILPGTIIESNGQQLLAPLTPDALDNFSGAPERSFIGREEQEFKDASIKLDYDFDDLTLTWISAYQDAAQELIGDLDWSKRNLFLQDLTDNFEIVSHELRLTSSSVSTWRWLAGAYYQKRDGLNKLQIRTEPMPGQIGDAIFFQTDTKEDTIKALFAQVNYDITDSLELTLAARYDKVDYQTSRPVTEPSPYLNEQGQPTRTLQDSDSEIQPKLSLSWDISDDTMLYVTYAAGFRPGFYNTGTRTKAETTNNYEIGGKSMWLDNRLQLNGALFYIDYSEQQFSFITPQAPFRAVDNIPQTEIKGAELEAQLMLTRDLKFTTAVGYTNSKIKSSGLRAPVTPRYTVNLGLQYTTELGSNWVWDSRLDLRAQGDYFLDRENLYRVGARQYLNLSTALEHDNWRFTLYGDNLTDELTATDATGIINLLGSVTGIVRAYSPGRQLGASIEYKF